MLNCHKVHTLQHDLSQKVYEHLCMCVCVFWTRQLSVRVWQKFIQDYFWLQCPSGYYADSTGAITCTICPAGFECPDPTVSPVACGSGEVSTSPFLSFCFLFAFWNFKYYEQIFSWVNCTIEECAWLNIFSLATSAREHGLLECAFQLSSWFVWLRCKKTASCLLCVVSIHWRAPQAVSLVQRAPPVVQALSPPAV